MKDQRFNGQPTKERRFTRKFSETQKKLAKKTSDSKSSTTKSGNSVVNYLGNLWKLAFGFGKGDNYIWKGYHEDTLIVNNKIGHHADPQKRKLRKISRASRRYNLQHC